MKMFARNLKSFLELQGEPTSDKEIFNQKYLATKIHIGMFDLSADPFPDPATDRISREVVYRIDEEHLPVSKRTGQESLTESLTEFAAVTLKYASAGLFYLGNRTFNFIRAQSEKKFLNYNTVMVRWKSRVWKNARNIDGREFDAYQLNIVPHAEMVKRIYTVELIHKCLSNISGIYNAPIKKNSDDWATPECTKVITQLEKIGFKAKHLDENGGISKQYAESRKKQPLYLHGYTPKRIMDLLTRCEKLASYGDEKYINEFEKKYLAYGDALEDYDSDTEDKKFELEEKGKEKGESYTRKELQEIEHRKNESRVKSARMWWLAHFLKVAYVITGDIIADMEKLMRATENTLSTADEDANQPVV